MESNGAVPKKLRVFSRLQQTAFSAGVAVITIALASCGDTYRPVANPIIPPGGTPQQKFYAVVVGPNASTNGSATVVDVSGDTNMGNAVVGLNPTNVSLYSITRAIVANQASDSLTIFSPFSGPAYTTSTVTLPTGSQPVFSAQNSTKAYVADYGLNQVAVLQTLNSSNLTLSPSAFVNVGTHPIAVAITPDGTKVFCINRDDGTVTVISTADNSVITTLRVGRTPVGGAMRSDGAFYYVVNQADGTVSVIDTAAAAVIGTLTVGTSPSQAYFDSNLSRLYVANTGSNSVSIFSANSASPTLLSTVTTGSTPLSVTALADGSRFYVANSGDNTVTVFNASSFAQSKVIPVGTTPVWIASSPDSSKVYTANQASGDVSIINTSTDTVPVTLKTPTTSPSYIAITP